MTVPVDPTLSAYATLHADSLGGLEDEVQAVLTSIGRWGGDKPARVLRGAMEGTEGERYLYRLQIERQVYAPEFTAVDLSLRSKITKGIVTAVEDEGRTLVVETEDLLEGNLDEVVVTFDAIALIRALQEQIKLLAPGSQHRGMPTVLRTLGYTPATISYTQPQHPSIDIRGLNEGQIRAIGTAVGSDLSLPLGPPGTGKTRTLGSLVAELAEGHNERVLVTAHTNAALDTAMASVCDALGPEWVAEGKIVRMGSLSREFRHLGIGHKDIADRHGGTTADPELVAEVRALEISADALVPTLHRQTGRYKALPGKGAIDSRLAALLVRLASLRLVATGQERERARLLLRTQEIHRARAEQRGSVAHKARVVGVTLSNLCMEPIEPRLGRFASVVLDEASMVMLPQVILAAGVAERRFVAFGDPRQLPPVVMANTPRANAVLKRDLFHQLGVEDPSVDDSRRPMLTVQYRMAPQIRALVSSLFYAGRLEDDPDVAARTRHDGPSLLLIDTSRLLMPRGGEEDAERIPVTSAQKGSSRVNEGHAFLVRDLVGHLLDEGVSDVGVVTPFAAQMQLLRQTLGQSHPYFTRMGGFIRTIHRSQGGEKDVIIVDTVDAPPKLSSFLDDRWNQDLGQLLNVAMSRARHRLVLVAHCASLRARYRKSGSLIMRILERAYREGGYLPLGEVGLTENPFAPETLARLALAAAPPPRRPAGA